jgi:hypothetical protein
MCLEVNDAFIAKKKKDNDDDDLFKKYNFIFCTSIRTRKNCFRYLKLMAPLNAAICTTISYTLWVEWYYLKKQLFDLEVKGQGPTKVNMIRNTLPYGHAPTSSQRSLSGP